MSIFRLKHISVSTVAFQTVLSGPVPIPTSMPLPMTDTVLMFGRFELVWEASHIPPMWYGYNLKHRSPWEITHICRVVVSLAAVLENGERQFARDRRSIQTNPAPPPSISATNHPPFQAVGTCSAYELTHPLQTFQTPINSKSILRFFLILDQAFNIPFQHASRI